MRKLNSEQESIYYGGAEHRPPSISYLQAGPVQCQYEAGYLRYLKAGGRELLRMIYPAVRDHNWGTVAAQISNETFNIAEDHFEISYECLYKEEEILFFASYQIIGDVEGNISFILDGKALSTFRKNRIGFNVLHPAEVAGEKFALVHTNGSQEEGHFPKSISPHQPMMDIRTLSWEVQGLWVQVDFEGDVFEMEDQRNWTDASFKTYSTPLSLPFPATLKKGDKIHQKISLRLKSKFGVEADDEEKIKVTLGKESYPLTAIGISQSSEVEHLDDRSIDLLRQLNFSHYRVDLHLNEIGLEQKWKRIVAESEELGLPLELALHFGYENGKELGKLKDLLLIKLPLVNQVLIYAQEHKSTPDSIISQLLPDLRLMFPSIPIGSGTDCFFTELNRERVKHEGLDFLTYSINPQVHHFDNQSLVETLQAQAYTLDSARGIAEEKNVFISPVTLKMRFNPNATGPEPETPANALSPQVDTRQMSLFGAGWTLGSIKYLTEHNLSSVTYFETIGRRGIIPGIKTATFPEQKKSFYPMYWVLYQLLKQRDIKVIKSFSSAPLQLISIAWIKDRYLYLMMTNLQNTYKDVLINAGDKKWEQISLTAESFMEYPELPDEWEDVWIKTTPFLRMEPYSLYLFRSQSLSDSGFPYPQ